MEYDWDVDFKKLQGIPTRRELIQAALDKVAKELKEIRQGKPPPRRVVHRDGDHVWIETVQPSWEPPED